MPGAQSVDAFMASRSAGSGQSAPPSVDDFMASRQTAPPAAPPESHWYTGVGDTLEREASSLGNTIVQTPGAIAHAFTDAPTAEEQQQVAPGIDQGFRLGIHRLVAEPIVNAAKWYSDALHGNVPDPVGQALSVAPEAIGAGGGNVLFGKAVADAPGMVRGAADTAAPAVRLAGRALGSPTGARLTAGATGAAVGEAVGHPWIGYFAGEHVLRPVVGKIAESMQKFGRSAPVDPFADVPDPTADVFYQPEARPAAPEPAAAAPESAAGSVPQAGQIAQGMQQPAVAPERALRGQIDQLLNPSTLKPGVRIADQFNAQASAAPAPEVPQGFTAVEKPDSPVQSYKYDPDTREMHVQARSTGQVHVYGDVSPEDADAFANAPSKGRAWGAMKQNVQVAKVINGKRMALKPGGGSAAPDNEGVIRRGFAQKAGAGGD